MERTVINVSKETAERIKRNANCSSESYNRIITHLLEEYEKNLR